MNTVNLILQDKKGEYQVDVPVEAFEQLYGELGLSPGTGAWHFGDGDCACAQGLLGSLNKDDNPAMVGVSYVKQCSIAAGAFDRGGRGFEAPDRGNDPRYLASKALGDYFRERLGEILPDYRNEFNR